ncbi:uncharacterized protein LOC144137918 [Haemaphysalis longicornis]|uniref:Uncharacterized protein n=1 Tax=Haemaphysalis longicornis TaxID=44386 RepID=A0A9J6FUM3_HAELO|nr:hypothetical protein HPB48_013340 [Haemaphysalis longicornis]
MAAPNGGCVEDGGVAPAEPAPDDDDALDMRFAALQAKVNVACRQFVLLNEQIRDLKRLCKRAERNNKSALRYSIRMKMSIMTGVKMMYDHYITANLAELQGVVALLEAKIAARRYSVAGRVQD